MELHRIYSPKHRYSEEVKREAVKMYLSGIHRKKEITEKFGMSYPALDRWILEYGAEYVTRQEDLEEVSLEEMKKKDTSEAEELERRIKELEKKLELATMKSEILETMIEIAEEELHIPIRKKFGSQPSNEKHKRTK